MNDDLPRTLIEAVRYFADLDVCHRYLRRIKWPTGKPTCPHCGAASDRIGEIKTLRLLRCKDCRKKIYDLQGTIFEDSKIKLDKWLPAVWAVANCKNGISSHELARALGVTQKTAWFMSHRIREARSPMKTKKPVASKAKPKKPVAKLKSLKHIKKLSNLLALAMKDLRKQERGKNCVVNMREWWRPKGSGRKTCVACMAGSVMKYSLVQPSGRPPIVFPEDYDWPTARRLEAINYLGCGHLKSAAVCLRKTTKLSDRCMPEYGDELFWDAFEGLLADLKAAGE